MLRRRVRRLLLAVPEAAVPVVADDVDVGRHNVDIIGHNRYGGLRYCKKQTTYTSAQHYFTEDDIMQAGQSCINHKKVWTNWDFSRAPLLPEEDHPDHKFHPEVVSGKWGLTCKHPEDPIKCPRARICVPGVDCFEDHKDFTDWRTMRDSWGVMNLALLSLIHI